MKTTYMLSIVHNSDLMYYFIIYVKKLWVFDSIELYFLNKLTT